VSHVNPPGDVGGVYVLDVFGGERAQLLKHVSGTGRTPRPRPAALPTLPTRRGSSTSSARRPEIEMTAGYHTVELTASPNG